jgi:hypothetical protein
MGNVKDNAYVAVRRFTDYPAWWWYNSIAGYKWSDSPYLFFLTPYEACYIGLEDQVLEKVLELAEQYEGIWSSI